MRSLTTEYIALEDRIRLSCDMAGSAPAVVWLSLRLLQRLLPVLLQWLESRSAVTLRPDAMHGFHLQAARAELTPLPPVRAAAGSAEWLAQSVDIAHLEQTLRLTFRGPGGKSATLLMEAKPLRQWLSIVHEAYLKAAWPLEVWPAWLRESAAPARNHVGALH